MKSEYLQVVNKKLETIFGSMVVSGSLELKGGILPSGGLYATYHLLGEPETTIDWKGASKSRLGSPRMLPRSGLVVFGAVTGNTFYDNETCECEKTCFVWRI